MNDFIALNSTQPRAVTRYKREVQAIVVDRAADYIEQMLPQGPRPGGPHYEKAFQEGLQRAKLDVMSELFRIMHDLARPKGVAGWSRGEDGLRRREPNARATMDMLTSYEKVVQYVSSIPVEVNGVEQ